MEGYKGNSSTPIVMNGTGYLNPNNNRARNTFKAPLKPTTLRQYTCSHGSGGMITDYSMYRKMQSPDTRLGKLF